MDGYRVEVHCNNIMVIIHVLHIYITAESQFLRPIQLKSKVVSLTLDEHSSFTPNFSWLVPWFTNQAQATLANQLAMF